MKELFEISLVLISLLKIKTEKEYNELHKDFFVLSAESLKYIAQTRNFKDIVKMASL